MTYCYIQTIQVHTHRHMFKSTVFCNSCVQAGGMPKDLLSRLGGASEIEIFGPGGSIATPGKHVSG